MKCVVLGRGEWSGRACVRAGVARQLRLAALGWEGDKSKAACRLVRSPPARGAPSLASGPWPCYVISTGLLGQLSNIPFFSGTAFLFLVGDRVGLLDFLHLGIALRLDASLHRSLIGFDGEAGNELEPSLVPRA